MLRVSLKELVAHRFRLVLTSIAVVLGVAFMSGTFVLTDTLGHVFDSLFSQTTKGIAAVVRAKEPFKAGHTRGGAGITGNRPPVPATLLTELGSVRGVKSARGAVQGYALVVGRNGRAIINAGGGPPTLGIVWGSDPDLEQSLHLLRQPGAHRPVGPSEVALDESTARRAHLEVGDTVRIVFLSVPPREFTVSGLFKFGDAGNLAGATLAAFDAPTAQQVLNRVGKWDQIVFSARPGVSETTLRDRLRATLRTVPDGAAYEAITGKQLAAETASNIKQGLGFFNTFLLIFAVVALFVGSFIIYNTFSIIVAQRARELALLRALGASARQVTRSVAVEALAVGLLSSAVGLGLGVVVAIGLQALLRGFGIDLPTGSSVILPRTIVVALLVGTLVTFLAAIAPARRAARVPPIAVLRDQGTASTSGRRRFSVGAAVTALGLALLVVGLVGDVKSRSFPGGAPGIIGAAAVLVFVGVAMLSPLVARPVSRGLGWLPARVRGAAGQLARENAVRNPRRTASTAAALMIGLALVSFIAIVGASAKASFSRVIDESVRADLLLSGRNFSTLISPEASRSLRAALPGAAVVEFRAGSWQYRGDVRELLGVSPDIAEAVDVGIRRGADLAAFAGGGVLVYEPTAARNHWRVGDTIPMRFVRTGVRDVPIRGTFTRKDAVGTSYLLSLRDYQADFVDQADAFVAVRRAPGTSAPQTRRVVDRVLKAYPNVRAQDQTQFKASQQQQFDQLLNLVYVLLLLSVVIALIGIVNTLALSILERTREIGLLRAVGMTRAQVRRMVRYEAVIVSVFGALLGLVIGIVFGRAIVGTLSDQGVAFSLPARQLALFVVLAGLAGLTAGYLPARRAAKLDVLRAITTE